MTAISDVTLISENCKRFMQKLHEKANHRQPEQSTMYVTHVTREDIILGLLSHMKTFEKRTGNVWKGALLLTGVTDKMQPDSYVVEMLQDAGVMCILTDTNSA